MEIEPDFGCPLCLDLLHDPVITPCGHRFCRTCILRACGSRRSSCPLCRGELQCFDPLVEPSDAEWVALMATALPQSVLAKRQSQAPRLMELIVSNLCEEEPNNDNTPHKWIIWVSLGGLFNGRASQIIDKVVYELPPTSRQKFLTAYPPFFSLSRHSRAAFTVRCQIHWNPMLGMRPVEVDHPLAFRQDGNRSVAWIEAGPAALDIVEPKRPARAPCSAAKLQLHERAGCFNALGLEVAQTTASGKAATRIPWLPRDTSPLEVVVGNLHQVSSMPQDLERYHEWTIYIALPEFKESISKMITHVVYNLNPTFSPDAYTKQSPNLELICLGSETCKVTCTIHWNPLLALQPTKLVHEAVSGEFGGQTSVTICVSPRRLHFVA
mmetsp:Transcript_39961/g.79043  ORF Transcript_39961/g.79043 Transcript_39961/m.79043 type:complete len:382 (-) Transcript_39961:182-1327(-)